MSAVGVAQAIGTLLSVLVIPFVIQLVKTHAMSRNASRWTAVALSLLAGVVTGLAGGLPASTGDWVTCILAVVGGVQIAYTAFRNVGVTDRWMDALMNVGRVAKPADPATAKAQQ